MSKLRKLGDSNPRYGNPYVSLANWWFQPLTQPSFSHRKEALPTPFLKSECKINTFFRIDQIKVHFF